MAVKSFNKKGRRRRRIFRIVLAIVAILFFLWFMIADMWRIHDVHVVGARHTDSSAIQQHIWDILDHKRLLVLPGNQSYIYAHGRIIDEVMQNFPGVESIDIDVDRHGLLTVTIEDRRALGVWCDASDCYFYDDAGVLFKKSFSYTGALFTRWKYAATEAAVRLGEKVPCIDVCMNEEFLYFLHDKRIDEAVIDKEMLKLTSTDGYYLKASFGATTTMGHIEQLEKKEPGILGKVEYVDVRFPHKIFYRVKGE